MTLTLLQICQSAADEVGIMRPDAVIGSQAPEVQKLLRYAVKEGREVIKRGYWQGLRSEQTFTSLAQESQTNMIPTDFDRFVNETFWNRSRRRPLLGPVTPQQWQNIKAWTTSPVQDTFIVRGSNILISPVPAAGQTFAFEYISKNYCQSSGGTAQSVWTADTDTPRLPDEIFVLGVTWRYKQSEGLPFENDLGAYEGQIKQYLTSDTAKRTISMSQSQVGMNGRPGVVVPEGDWSI